VIPWRSKNRATELLLVRIRRLRSSLQQAGEMRRIGVLMAFAENDPEGRLNVAAFRAGLRKLERVEGLNIRIDTRWGGASRRHVKTAIREGTRRHAA
jgi:putative ABC transport system substrate-binding protein